MRQVAVRDLQPGSVIPTGIGDLVVDRVEARDDGFRIFHSGARTGSFWRESTAVFEVDDE